MTNGRNVLRNTYIATYYMDRCNERVYLEALQHRLEGELGQLTEMLRQLPHRRAMLEGASPVDRAPGLRKDSFSVLLGMAFTMLRDIGHGFICTLLRVLNAQSTVLEEVSLRGRQARSPAQEHATLRCPEDFFVPAGKCVPARSSMCAIDHDAVSSRAAYHTVVR